MAKKGQRGRTCCCCFWAMLAELQRPGLQISFDFFMFWRDGLLINFDDHIIWWWNIQLQAMACCFVKKIQKKKLFFLSRKMLTIKAFSPYSFSHSSIFFFWSVKKKKDIKIFWWYRIGSSFFKILQEYLKNPALLMYESVILFVQVYTRNSKMKKWHKI